MKKAFALSLLFALCVILSAQAAALPHVADQAGTFTPEQEAVLQARMEQIWDKYQFDALIVTTRDSKGYSAKAYAAEFFEGFRENFPSYPNGITFSFNFDLGDYFSSTRGIGERIFPTGDNTQLERVLRPSFKNKDYYAGMLAYLDYVEQTLSMHSTTDSSGIVTLTTQRRNPSFSESIQYVAMPLAPIIAIVALGIGIGYAFYAKSKLLIAAHQHQASAYAQRGPSFTDASDIFLYQTEIRTRLPDNNTRSGGGSRGGGSYTSSSGRSYGGSGGKL